MLYHIEQIKCTIHGWKQQTTKERLRLIMSLTKMLTDIAHFIASKIRIVLEVA